SSSTNSSSSSSSTASTGTAAHDSRGKDLPCVKTPTPRTHADSDSVFMCDGRGALTGVVVLSLRGVRVCCCVCVVVSCWSLSICWCNAIKSQECNNLPELNQYQNFSSSLESLEL